MVKTLRRKQLNYHPRFLPFTIHHLLVQERLHAMKSAGSFAEAGLLFECFAVVTRRFQILLARLVNTPQVEMRKSVGFITGRIERAFEPAHARISIALG